MHSPKLISLKSIDGHRKSNSIHSPTTIKNTTAELLSPGHGSPTGGPVFLKMKYTTASSTRASPMNKPHPPSSINHSKHRQSTAVNTPTNLSEKINFAPYMLFFPKEEINLQTQKADLRKNNFFTFRDLADKGATPTAEARELFSPFTTRRTLAKQLDFNKEQQVLFQKTADNFLSKSQSVLTFEKQEKEKKVKKMPKIRVQPSARLSEPQKLIFDEELSHRDHDDEERTRVKHPKYIKFIKFDASDKYHFHWSTIADSELAAFKPVVREGASFLVIGKYAYLYGGRSKGLNNDLAILDITKWKWSQPPPQKELPPGGRAGHTANTYKKLMVIFGGARSFNVTLNMRECLNDVTFYNTESHEWNYVKCSGEFIEPRRHHTAVIVGKHLLVHGGIGSTGEYLDDLKCLDLVSYRWGSCKESNKDDVGVAFHKSCVVLYEFRREINLFKMHDFRNDDKSPLIKEEGIYFFGGRYPDDSMSNTLKILKIGQSTLKWITPETIGKPPEARYLHTMVHSKSLNMLIIYGGRNDQLFGQGESPILGDFCTLQLDTLTWVSVSTLGAVGGARFAHVSAAIGTSVIIFGGINFNVFCPADINLIEMDQMVVNKLVNKHRASGGSDMILNYHNKMNLNPEVKMDDQDDMQNKYAGITSFLPLPSQAKREKSPTTDLPTLFKDYFNARRASLSNRLES